MSEDADQNRSEPPSSFKLDRARREGNVARGTDLGFLSAAAVLTAFVWFAGERMVAAWSAGMATGLAAVGASPVSWSGYAALAATSAKPIVAMATPFVAALFIVVLLFEFIQTGPVFSTRALRIDFTRLNPANGVKRLFSVRMLAETFKATLKLVLYGAVGALVVRGVLRQAPLLTDALHLSEGMGEALRRLFGAILGAALVVALLDQGVARRDFLKKMRMSRREQKREHRDREGDPRLRQKRKELHAQFVKTSQSLKGIREADLIIVNPVHYAVALRYRPEIVDAPVVVARGAHALALRLKKLAFAYGVPMVVDPGLARRLYGACALNQPAPDALFQALADAYVMARRQKNGEIGNG